MPLTAARPGASPAAAFRYTGRRDCMIRLVAIDLDGTLLDSRGQLPEANRRAVAAALARQVEIVLVTGRRFDFACQAVSSLPGELTFVVNNGALIKSRDGKNWLRRLLPRAVAAQVLATTLAYRHYAALVFDRSERPVVVEQNTWENPARRSYLERNRSSLLTCSPLESALVEDPIQVLFAGPLGPLRELRHCLERAPRADSFSVAVTEYPERDFALIDVIAAGCSKGVALRLWAERRGLSAEEVMAIGDNLNDGDMLAFAGWPVVMANAPAELKRAGWFVTRSNDEAGVAAALERFLLQNGGEGGAGDLGGVGGAPAVGAG